MGLTVAMPLNLNEIHFEKFRFSFGEKCLFAGDQVVSLTGKECEILCALLEAAGQVVSKDKLFARLWPEAIVDESNLFHHVRALRKKLGGRADGGLFIETVPGRGYRFVADAKSEAVQTPVNNEPEKHLPLVRGKALAVLAALVLLTAGAFTFSQRKARPMPAPDASTILTRPDIAQVPRVVKLINIASQASSVLLNPDRGELFVSEPAADSVTIINTVSNKIVGRIAVGQGPGSMTFSPDRKKLFIAHSGGGVGVMDTATHSFQFAAGFKDRVDDVLVTPDGKSVYLALGFRGVGKLDIANRSVKILSKTGYAIALALTPDGRRLYVSYQGGGPGGKFGHDAIGYFDTANDRFAGAMSGFANVGGVIAVSRDGSHIWENGADACDSAQYDHVGCPAVPAGLINIFRAADNKLVKPLAVRGARLLGMTFSPDGHYVAVGSTHGLIILNSQDYSIAGILPYGSTLKIAFTPDGLKAYSPVNEIPAVALIQLGVEVRALRLANRDSREQMLEIGIVTSPDLNAESIDPESLRLDGVPVQRSGTGALDASVDGIAGFAGHTLIVHFKVEGGKKLSRLSLSGKTYSGMPVKGTVDAM